MGSSRRETLQMLARRIRQIESGHRPLSRPAVSTAIPALDDLLPERRLHAGSLVELLSAADGAGAWTLALLLAERACGERGVLVVIDQQKCFYPPAAARLGVDLDRAIVVRPASWQDAYAAADQSLRCQAVGAVIGCYERLRMLDGRRLQLAAESGGGLGFLLRPTGALRVASCAAVRFLVAPLASERTTRRIRVDLVRCRGGKCGQSLVLEIDDATGHVHVPAGAGDRAALAGAARASG